jgi:hypothetical protein
MTMPVVIMVPLVLWALVLGLTPVSQLRVLRFVHLTDVELTDDNAALVMDGIVRTRRWRAALTMVLVSCLVAVQILVDQVSISTMTAVVASAGVLVGTVIGELRSAARRGDGPRTASLDVRVESAYVGDWARTGTLVLGVVGVLVAMIATAVTGDVVQGLAALVVSLLPALLDRWATRVILERPRPGEQGHNVVAADDGLRSRALHGIGGVSLFAGACALIAMVAVLLTGRPTPSPVDWVPSTAPISGPLAALVLVAITSAGWISWRLSQRRFVVPSARVASALDEAAEA